MDSPALSSKPTRRGASAAIRCATRTFSVGRDGRIIGSGRRGYSWGESQSGAGSANIPGAGANRTGQEERTPLGSDPERDA
eukprot:4203600-Pyramimonas_sp.AAC.1